MKTIQIASVATSTVLVAGGVMGAAALACDPAVAEGATTAPDPLVAEIGESPMVLLPDANGLFAYAQSQISSLDEIRQALGTAPQYLCGAEDSQTGGLTESSAKDWQITIGGSVSNAFAATLGELAEDGEAHAVMMGCSCAGSPAADYGAVNVETTGVALASIMERAGLSEATNTVVFTSEDGYEVALPLSFVKHRFAMVVYAINGEDLANSVGGTNQVWMGATSAQNFARNVVSIEFQERQTPPSVPGLTTVEAA